MPEILKDITLKLVIDTNKETNDKTIAKPYYDDSTNEYSKLLRKGYHDLKKNLFNLSKMILKKQSQLHLI
jgi:hypothetical protein